MNYIGMASECRLSAAGVSCVEADVIHGKCGKLDLI